MQHISKVINTDLYVFHINDHSIELKLEPCALGSEYMFGTTYCWAIKVLKNYDGYFYPMLF